MDLQEHRGSFNTVGLCCAASDVRNPVFGCATCEQRTGSSERGVK